MAPPNLKFERVQVPDAMFVEDAVEIFLSLTREDPVVVALTGADTSLLPDLCRAMISGLVLAPGVGEAYAARNENGVLVGFLVFSLPGQLLFAAEGSRARGFSEYAARLSDGGREYFLKVMPKLPPETNEEFQLELASYWCDLAFIRADYQHKGVGKALFKLSFDRAHELGAKEVGLTAMNPINLPIYKAIGFDLVKHELIKSPWSEYNLWFFVKKVGET